MGKLDIFGLLGEHGAVLSGHFRLSSGLHSSSYVQTALILQYPHIASRIAKALSLKFPQHIDCVCSPAMGAVVIGQEVARAKKCRAIFTEKVGGANILRRDFHIEKGEKILVVEDVLTTGRSTSEVVNLGRNYGAKVLGVGAIVDRTISPPALDVPFRSLISYPLEVFPPENCDLCKRGMPLTSPGSRYLEPAA
ncbi:MAG: orotate phosphoribosyltransferase [Elusimicrobia bacterium]|nr:orotate phosphoribosyltransferase [Elusimicrobiota bacterium]